VRRKHKANCGRRSKSSQKGVEAHNQLGNSPEGLVEEVTLVGGAVWKLGRLVTGLQLPSPFAYMGAGYAAPVIAQSAVGFGQPVSFNRHRNGIARDRTPVSLQDLDYYGNRIP
jgi:hypothetical protein